MVGNALGVYLEDTPKGGRINEIRALFYRPRTELYQCPG